MEPENIAIDRTSLNLAGTTDAQVWTEEFTKKYRLSMKRSTSGGEMWERQPFAMTGDIMLGWFANAIMAGHDWGQRLARENLNEAFRRNLRFNGWCCAFFGALVGFLAGWLFVR